MTITQADKIIKNKSLTKVHSDRYNETFERVFVHREKRNIISEDGGIF